MITCILGPTGSGKTGLSLLVAKAVKGSIIGCDSVQVYRGFNIGSGKVTDEEKGTIPHYLIDCAEASEDFTVSDYLVAVEEALGTIEDCHGIPLIVGGTGLYYKAFAYQYALTKEETNRVYRDSLYALAEKKGRRALYEMLQKVDPYSAERIHPNHITRMVRALEVYKQTGRYVWQQEKETLGLRENLQSFGLLVDRDILYRQINQRVDLMVQEGLVEEVCALLEKGISKASGPMKTIGYKEIVGYLEGQYDLSEAINLIKQNSRRYSKRQMTWFKKHPEIQWLPYTTKAEKEKAVQKVIESIKDN